MSNNAALLSEMKFWRQRDQPGSAQQGTVEQQSFVSTNCYVEVSALGLIKPVCVCASGGHPRTHTEMFIVDGGRLFHSPLGLECIHTLLVVSNIWLKHSVVDIPGKYLNLLLQGHPCLNCIQL